MTTPENVPLVETLPAVHNVVAFDKRGADRGLRGMLRTAAKMKQRNFDRVYLPHESVRSAFVARLAGIPERIGFAGTPGAWLYTHRCAPQGVRHETERLHSLANVQAPCPPTHVELTGSDTARAKAELHTAGIAGDYIVLAPGSRRPTKRWPYFVGLAELLGHDYDLAFVGGPDDMAIADRVARGEHRMANLAGKLSIRETAAIMQTARLVVCNDSVALHLANAMTTQVVAIFGPTDASLGFGPRGKTDVTIGKPNLNCRPCSTHGGERCPLRHHRCMVDLEVDTVAQIIHNALRAEEKRSCE